jgi:malate/lactate dehydrogenase
MSLVAIIGAGEIGGAVARALASRARVDSVRLIDEKISIARGKALD